MSTNISKKKRDDLLDKIKQIRAFIAAAPQDENTGNLLSYLSELEKDVNGKKYGLVFEEHREEIDEVLDTHTPVLTEDADLFIDHGVQMNFLIEGDNLASLQLLEKTHKGKIDLIYIDPPYNTGAKDFVYDDAFVDTTDGFNHSKWLSFMKQRLSLSKKLLAAHGTIFISIDDNEFSQLKLLCDEVFGANNYVGTILWKKKTNGNNMGWLPPVHDYILCYSKEIGKIYDFGFEVSEEDILKNYSNPDNDPRGPWTTTDLSANHKGPYFPVTNPKTGDVYYPPAGRYWVFNEQEIQRRIADGRIIFGKSGMARPVQRVFAKDRKFSKRKVESWWDNHGMNADATQELKDIYASRTAERQQLYRKRNAEEANSIPAKYIVGYHDIPDKDLTAYPLVSTSIAAKDVDYDLIVYDTYDYLDKLIGFKLSDIFYAIFYQYYEATSDERALRLAKYFKYGTDKEREIWMLRYGFSFEEIEWVSECVDSIDETEIKFNDKINALDDAQLKSIEQYVHE